MIVQRLVEFVKSFPDLPLYLALVAILPRRARTDDDLCDVRLHTCSFALG